MLTAQNDKQSIDQAAAPSVGANSSAPDQFVPTNSFLDILFNNKKLSAEQIESLRNESLSSNKTYEDLIKEKGLLDDKEVGQAKAEFNHLGYIDIEKVGIDPEALGLIDESIAKKYKVLPFAFDN